MSTLSVAKTTQPLFDVYAVRRDFPILSQQVNGKPLVYLDNGASSQRPEAVLQAMDSYYREMHSNVHRGAHTLADRATTAFEGARKKVQQFLNAPSAREIIWTRGTTEAINLVANGLAPLLKPGDEILLSQMEHHANIVPWQMLAERTGAKVLAIDVTPEGEMDMDSFHSLLGERTRVLAITHVSNALGTVNPVADMVAKAKAQGVTTLVDGAQAVGHFQPDVQALDCDFYVFSAHKLFGPTGIGVLYGKSGLLEAMPPWQGGGEMIERVSFAGTTYNTLPYKFEAAESGLLQRANELVTSVPGMTIIGTSPNKVPLISFKIDGLHPSDIGTLLDQQGIAIRAGHHCAMPLMEYYGLPGGTARASFAFYNTLEEVEQLFAALQKIQRLFA